MTIQRDAPTAHEKFKHVCRAREEALVGTDGVDVPRRDAHHSDNQKNS